MYYSQGSVDEVVVPPLEKTKDDLSKFKDLKIDFTALDNPLIKDLKVFGESPLVPGLAGKKDIFAPIQ